MTIDERLSFFHELMCCNYRVYLWCYSPDLTLLHTNCPPGTAPGDAVSLIDFSSALLSYIKKGGRKPFILDTLHPDADQLGDVWELYKPASEGPAAMPDGCVNKKRYLPVIGLLTITLVIENIIGLDISLPRKTVNWTMQSLEEMGIEDLSLKKNNITILANKNTRGWEIRLESEKLYYFTIHILDEDKKKTLPIPSGKCSMLIDKL